MAPSRNNISGCLVDSLSTVYGPSRIEAGFFSSKSVSGPRWVGRRFNRDIPFTSCTSTGFLRDWYRLWTVFPGWYVFSFEPFLTSFFSDGRITSYGIHDFNPRRKYPPVEIYTYTSRALHSLGSFLGLPMGRGAGGACWIFVVSGKKLSMVPT